MEIRFEVPAFIEDVLRAQGDDPNHVAKELILVGWFRPGLIAWGSRVEMPLTHEILAPIHEEFRRAA